jgi:hypothetical protein
MTYLNEDQSTTGWFVALARGKSESMK